MGVSRIDLVMVITSSRIFDPARYSRFVEECRFIDLCEMDAWESDYFDLVLHSHVLEHTPCTLAYSLFHLHRILKKDGLHLFIVPFSSGRWDECFQSISDEERIRRFLQADHMRRIGKEDIDRHIGRLLRLPAEFDATADFSERELTDANIPENHWRGWHMGTVLRLRKTEIRLSGQAGYQGSEMDRQNEQVKAQHGDQP